MEVLNKSTFYQKSISYGIKGNSSNEPLTTSDDIAVEILVDEDGDFTGYKSLTLELSKLDLLGTPASDDYLPETYYEEGDELPEGIQVGDVKTEQVGIAPTGIYEIINNISGLIEEVSEEKINSLFEKISEDVDINK